MATLSVMSYNLAQGLKMKTNENSGGQNNLAKTFNKITVQNVLSENVSNAINISNNSQIGGSSNINNANTIVKKIKDFGMIGAVNAVHSNSNNLNKTTNAARKRPLGETKSNSNIMLLKTATSTPVIKKPKLCNKSATTPKSSTKKVCENVNSLQSKSPPNDEAPHAAGTPGRKGLPAPQAVARRNARERNRVKQVNNGFAALRERIPEEVAEVFESQSTAAGARGAAAKKLSKVETLRMAVEYIRSLERMLGFDFPIGGGDGGGSNAAGDDSFALIKDEFGALSPGIDDQYDDSMSNYELDDDLAPAAATPSLGDFAAAAQDLLPAITSLNGLQYIRIPGTNTYQLLTPELFLGGHVANNLSPRIDDEQFNALIDTNCHSPSSSASTTGTADLHSSPTSIMQTTTAATTPAHHVSAVDAAATSSSLSRSPVPQTSSPSAVASPLQQRSSMARTSLSPVANEILLQTCASRFAIGGNNLRNEQRQFVAPTPPQQQHPQQQHKMPLIKQEYIETDFCAPLPALSPNSNAIVYQPLILDPQQHQQRVQQQQPLLLGQHNSMSMSPPLDNSNMAMVAAAAHALPGFFDQDHGGSFYEGVVSFKKELQDVMLDTSHTSTGLSDESMMEAIDWWEAHTPKSDGGSVIM